MEESYTMPSLNPEPIDTEKIRQALVKSIIEQGLPSPFETILFIPPDIYVRAIDLFILGSLKLLEINIRANLHLSQISNNINYLQLPYSIPLSIPMKG